MEGMAETVFIVWAGHRDYEENKAVFATEEEAEEFLRENGVKPRRVPLYVESAPLEMMDEDHTPWGIMECPYYGGTP